MPELPDLETYAAALRPRVIGEPIRAFDVDSPFVLRTVEPSPGELVGKSIDRVERLGKRLVLATGDVYMVLHLMIAGRLRWRPPDQRPPGRRVLLRITFDRGVLWLTEASTKQRASLHLVRGAERLAEFDRGGLEVLDADLEAFTAALRRENRTLKRALTDQTLFAGIGNAYSDEILFAARLSPVKLTSRLDDDEVARLFAATREQLMSWTERLLAELDGEFPDKVTAFRDEMFAHGRYREPCRVCAEPIQRIRYASNECNYCACCQNAGRLLADRGLSQLMRKDWPKTLEELEERRSR